MKFGIDKTVTVIDPGRTNYQESGKIIDFMPVPDGAGEAVAVFGLPVVNISAFYLVEFFNKNIEVQRQWHADDELALVIEV